MAQPRLMPQSLHVQPALPYMLYRSKEHGLWLWPSGNKTNINFIVVFGVLRGINSYAIYKNLYQVGGKFHPHFSSLSFRDKGTDAKANVLVEFHKFTGDFTRVISLQ